MIVGAEETVIPRKELAAEVEPSVVVRAFVTPVAVEPTGTVTRAVMITEPAATWTATKDGGTWGEMRGGRCRGRLTRRGDEAGRGREGEGRCGSHPGRQRKPELEIRLNLLIIVGHAAGRHKRDIDRSSAPLNVTQNVNARRDPFEERAAQGVDAAAHWCRRGVAQRTRRTEAPACGARAALGADDRGHCLCGLGGRDVRRGR